MQLVEVFGLAVLGSVAGLIGVVVYFLKDSWTKFFCEYSVPFAAGVLLTVTFTDLIPEAQHLLGARVFTVVLISFLVSFIFEQFFFQIHHHDEQRSKISPAVVPMVILGDSIHNFIDGIAIASSYLVNPALGLVVAVSTFLHEIPHEIGDFGVLMSAGFTRMKAVLANFFSALTTFLGAGLVYFFAAGESQITGITLAVAAGLFLYLGAADFLPDIRADEKNASKKVIALVLGVVIMFLVSGLVPHG